MSIAGAVSSPVPAAEGLSSITSAMGSGFNFEDVFYSTLTVLLEIAVLGRVFLVPILAERNVVLAENILKECREEVLRQQRTNDKKQRAVVAVLGQLPILFFLVDDYYFSNYH